MTPTPPAPPPTVWVAQALPPEESVGKGSSDAPSPPPSGAGGETLPAPEATPEPPAQPDKAASAARPAQREGTVAEQAAREQREALQAITGGLAAQAPWASWDFKKLGFGREFEMSGGHFSGDHLPGGFGAGLGVRQRFFWFGAARLSLAGAVSPGSRAVVSPISPVGRADLLLGTGPLIPGFEPYGGMGLMWSTGTVVVDNVPTLGSAARPSWVAGLKFAGFYAELQLDAALDAAARAQGLTERTVLQGGFCFPI